MSSKLVGEVNPLASKPAVADSATIRKFVKDFAEVSETIKDARDDVREAISSNEEIKKIDEQIKKLREERKDVIDTNPVIRGYRDILDDAMDDRRQLISDANNDGVPRKEIDLAIKALKSDIDISVSAEIYSSISDLVD